MEEDTLLFDQTLNKIEFLFRYAGMYIKGEESTNRLKSRIIIIFNFLLVNSYLLGSFSWFIDGVISGKDFLSLTYCAPCLSLTSLGNFKYFFLIINEKYVHKLLGILRKMEIQGKERKQSEKKVEIVTQERKFLHTVINTTNILYVVLIVTFGLSACVISAVKYLQSKQLELNLPFLVLYPFDPFQMKVWPFVYLHQLWAGCVVILFVSLADYFYLTCCSYIRIQFRLLQHDLENIIPVDATSNKKYLEDDEFKNSFKELVKWHQDLIESADMLEIIYTKSTLFNFLSSSVVICFTGFNVTMVKDVAFMINFLVFLFMSLVQIFVLCFFADMVMASSMEISEAVYNSQWYMAESKIGKKLLVILTRSQKPCKLTVSGYADVNLNLFMRVLSTSWSYFALLQTMYGN